MATTGRSTDATPAPDAVATLLDDAAVVQLLGRPDGDALAAAGILGRALDALDTPYQVSLATSRADAETRLLDGGPTIGLGLDVGAAALVTDSVALDAYETVTALETDPDPVLAIAGAVAGGSVPKGPALDAAEARGVSRRPGIGLPIADLGAGLAYSGLLHGSFSGDEQSAGAFLAELDLPAELDGDAHTRLASAIALDVTDGATSERAVEALEPVLAPLETPGPFETVEGYADVLQALAVGDPGTGLAFVLGHAGRSDAVDAWKAAGTRLHRTVERASLSAVGDIAVASVEDGAPERVARLVRDFRAEESVVLVAGPTSLAFATVDEDAHDVLGTVFEDARVTGTERLAVADEQADPTTVATRIQEIR